MKERIHSIITDYGGLSRVLSDGVPLSCRGRWTDNPSQDRNQRIPDGKVQPFPVMMIPGRILLPVDITKCPLEVFSFVNKFAADRRVTVTLLHVPNLNVLVMESRIIEDLSRAAEQHLKRMAEKFLNPQLSVRLRVRHGKPAQEILAEARESNVDLILLTSYGGCSFWKRPFQPRIVEKVLRSAPCNTTVLHVRTRFNCEEDCAGVDDSVSVFKYTGLAGLPTLATT